MDFVDILGNGLRSAFSAETAAFALLALGLNLHYGFTGLLNFGQVGFMLIGAYGVGVTVITWNASMWLGIVVAIVGAIIFALLLGVPTLRLRADYFAITTIAAAEALRLVIRSSSSTDVTGGPFGLQGFGNDFFVINPIPSGTYGLGQLKYNHVQLWALLVTWGVAILAALLIVLLIRSPWGRVIKAIREDEDVVRALGKNVFSYKLQSLIIGGVLGAIGGAMFAIAGQTAHADSYRPQVTFFAFTILIIGGVASRFGPIYGAIIFWFLYSALSAAVRQAGSAGYLPSWMSESVDAGAITLTVVGIALMLLMIYRPQGLLGSRREMLVESR